jgi:transposase
MAKRKQSTFERLAKGKMNRKQRKEFFRRLRSDDLGLEVVHPHTAGIDIGNESHYVAVAPGRDPEPVREFGSWTAEVIRMSEWLKSCGITDVVMQSTGVYWIAAYEVLEKAGFRVCLANAHDTKNLPGRKTDVQESQWLLKLHTYGLLRNSFRPPEEIRQVRTIWRLRQRHVQDASREIQHMQKALTTMNVQFANAISDLSGVTGQTIIRAILKGERDPHKLAEMKDYRIRASHEEIARSLEGYWQEDLLFELRQAVEKYDFIQQQIAECDRQLQIYMRALPDRKWEHPEESETGGGEQANGQPEATGESADHSRDRNRTKKKRRRKSPRDNEPGFDLSAEQTRICGVDLAAIDGVSVMTIQTFIAELGTDMSAWPTEKHLVSWLKLAPSRQISGGKVIKHDRRKINNRVTEALRMAASTLEHSDSFLGARFRYLKSRLGPKKAIKAMAAHLARLIYRMLTHGKAWVDRGVQAHEAKRNERETRSLQRKAAALGFRLEPAA